MKIVEVEWVDSNILHGWQNEINDCDVALCNEVGYLAHEDEDKVILARGISSFGLLNSPIAIPKGCVKSIKELTANE